MSITITSTPFDGLGVYDITPVYNGLQYVVEGGGQWPLRLGYKYLADVYVGGKLRTRLKHNVNVDTNAGYFDVGRIVETQVFSEAPINNTSTTTFEEKPNSVVYYEVKFGAEMDRRDTIKSWFVGAGLANVIPTAQRHNLRQGDAVIIEGCGQEDYNGVYSVPQVTTTSFRIDTAFINNPTIDGSFIECEQFFDNNYYYDPETGREFVGFVIPTARPTEIEVGDTVMVTQFDGATNQGYDGEWLVTDIDTTTVGFLTYQRIITNCPFLGNTPVNSGAIYPVNRKRVNTNEATTDGQAFNGVLQYDEFNDWDPEEYILDIGTPGKFLTNLPTLNMIKGLNSGTDNTRMVRVGQDEYMTLTTFYSSAFGNEIMDNFLVEWYDKDNNSLGTDVINYTISQSYGMYDFGFGPKNKIIDNDIPPNTKYYTIVGREIVAPVTEKITIYIRECDTRYTNVRLKYLNRLGGWDYFDFNKRSDESINVSRSQYRQNLVKTTSGSYGYEVGDRGNTTYNINASRSEKVRTDWLYDGEVEALEELWTSPQVFFLKGDEHIPINITTNTLQVGKAEHFGLKRYEIEYQHANNIFTQRL
jgi:hypothetical protein